MGRPHLSAPPAIALAAILLVAHQATGPLTGTSPPEDADPAAAAAAADRPDLLFFYYGWYSGGANGRHWADGTTDRPVAGYYDSHSLDDTRLQLGAIREAGGTGIIMSWWGDRSFEEESLRVALEAGEEEGVQVTASFETWAYEFRDAGAKTLAGQLEHLWRTHAQKSSWLKVDGKPVVFIHAACLHSEEKWAEAFRILEEKGIEFHAYGEIRENGDAEWMHRVFDGLYYYMPIELAKGRVLGNANREMTEVAEANGGEWLPTVAPAYDNSNDRLKRHHLVVDEEGGALIREGVSEALKLDSRFILLATWNEWAEGTAYERGERDQGRRLAALHEALGWSDAPDDPPPPLDGGPLLGVSDARVR